MLEKKGIYNYTKGTYRRTPWYTDLIYLNIITQIPVNATVKSLMVVIPVKIRYILLLAYTLKNYRQERP
jgi:hypothetical protein